MKTFEEAYELFFKMYGTGSGRILGHTKDDLKCILESFIEIMKDSKNE